MCVESEFQTMNGMNRTLARSNVPPLSAQPRQRFGLSLFVTSSLGVMASFGFVGSASAVDTGGANELVNAAGINSSGLARVNRAIEQTIAECLKAEGFTYRVGGANVPNDAADGGASNRQAFVKKYGYGVTTFVDPTKKPSDDLNMAYFASLSKSEQKSFNLALYGFDPIADPNGQFTPKSCLGQAFKVVGDPTAIQTVQSKIDDLEKRINADSAVVKAMRSWSGCMKQAGFTYAKDTDVEADFAKRLTKVSTTASGTLDAPALAKLQKLELDTAKADWDCSKKHLGVRDKVASQLNKDFVAANRAILDSVRKAISGKS